MALTAGVWIPCPKGAIPKMVNSSQSSWCPLRKRNARNKGGKGDDAVRRHDENLTAVTVGPDTGKKRDEKLRQKAAERGDGHH